MRWILSIAICIILIEFTILMPLKKIISGLVEVGHKASYIVRSKAISDHWKQKVVLYYAKMMFIFTMYLTFIFACISLVAILLLWGATFIDPDIQLFFLSWVGLLFSTAVFTIYIYTRRFLVAF